MRPDVGQDFTLTLLLLPALKCYSVKLGIMGAVMRAKAVGVCLVLAISVGLFIAMRSENRADAAGGNCYSDAAGPSAPTICQ